MDLDFHIRYFIEHKALPSNLYSEGARLLSRFMISGKKEVISVKIDEEVVDKDDIEMLEDLIMAAFNEASKKVDELSKEKMGPMGNLGGLM